MRLDDYFEAIDSDDCELYWTNRRAWGLKHGKTGYVKKRVYISKDALKKYREENYGI